jgi:hypothetical protein
MSSWEQKLRVVLTSNQNRVYGLQTASKLLIFHSLQRHIQTHKVAHNARFLDPSDEYRGWQRRARRSESSRTAIFITTSYKAARRTVPTQKESLITSSDLLHVWCQPACKGHLLDILLLLLLFRKCGFKRAQCPSLAKFMGEND